MDDAQCVRRWRGGIDGDRYRLAAITAPGVHSDGNIQEVGDAEHVPRAIGPPGALARRDVVRRSARGEWTGHPDLPGLLIEKKRLADTKLRQRVTRLGC